MTIRIWNTEITIQVRHVRRRRKRRFVQLYQAATALVSTLAWLVTL